MTQKLKQRNEVPVSETWDLRDLFENDAAYEDAILALVSRSEAFHKQYATTIRDVSSIESVLDALSELTIEIDRVANYSHLQLSVESTDPEKQRLNALFNQNYGKIASQLTFVESELLQLDTHVLQNAMQTSKYDYYLKRLLKRQPHQLHPEAEKVLAEMIAALNVPYDLYEVTKTLDIDFGQFEVNGKLYNMDYTTFEGIYEDDPDTDLRRQSFKHFSDTLRKYQHTTAAVYQAHVQNEKLEANLRGYTSVIDFLLEDQDVSADMYHRQIDIIMSDLAPIMRKYARLLKEVHQLDTMKYEDLKISIDPDYEPQISIQDSEQYIYNALSVLGEDYLKMTKKRIKNAGLIFLKIKGKKLVLIAQVHTLLIAIFSYHGLEK